MNNEAHEQKLKKDKFIEDNLKLVYFIAKKYKGRAEYEDIIQVGSIGLIKSYDKFDELKGYTFSTYASQIIDFEIKRYLRDNNYVHISRPIRISINKMCYVKGNLARTLNREPTDEEIIKEMNISLEHLHKLEKIFKETYPVYFDIVVHSGENGDSDILLKDAIESKSFDFEKLEDDILIEDLMNVLTIEEKNIIQLRYYEDLTQVQVAKKLNISQVQVSRIEKKAILKMKKNSKE